MIGKIITYILVIVFSIFLYHILKVDSMWRKIANIVLFVFLICLCIFGYVSDKHSAYYGDAVFECKNFGGAIVHGIDVFVKAVGPAELVFTGGAIIGFSHHTIAFGDVQSVFNK